MPVTGTSGQRAADNHDYRECFYDSQPDRGRAAQVCPRFPCRVYREGHQHGYADGYDDGFPDGIAACPRDHR